MGKIIKLTEQDLYRIVKRVIMESQNESVIVQCIKENANIQDVAKVAQFFIQCESCRRMVWLTGLQVFEDMMTGGKFKTPNPTDVIKIIINDPEIKNLTMPCLNEMMKYYQGMSEQDKIELRKKMSNIVACIVNKLLRGQISPIDLPIPDDIKLPDGFPKQFPTSGGDDSKTGNNPLDDMIDFGTDVFNKTKDEITKRFPFPGQ
jgi:hypothetical protein